MAIVESGKLAAAAVAFAIASSVCVAAQAPGASATTGTGVGDAASSASGPSPSRTSEMPAPSQTPQSGVPQADHDFLDEALRRGLTAVTLGGLAGEKAVSEQVRKFGERMISDHHDANEELMRLVTAKGIDLPAVLDKNDEKAIDDLADLSGAEFDRAYMKRVVSDHRSDVSKFQKEAQAGEDPDIRAAAQKILPVLREQLKMAESIQDNIEAGADNTGRAKQ